MATAKAKRAPNAVTKKVYLIVSTDNPPISLQNLIMNYSPDNSFYETADDAYNNADFDYRFNLVIEVEIKQVLSDKPLNGSANGLTKVNFKK